MAELHPDYRPVELGPYCNVGVGTYGRLVEQSTGSYLEERAEPPIGRQVLRGIPFLIGSEQGTGNCYIAPGQNPSAPLRIPIERSAEGIVVCHVLLGSDLWAGAPFGREVGRYRIDQIDQTNVTVPIRERMEIGNMPLPWGQYPLLCVQDRHDVLEDKRSTFVERAGFRQTEVQPSTPAAYFLWYWRNPRPDVSIDSITLTASMPGFLVAGITLSHVDEDPLRPQTRRTAKIDLGSQSVSADRSKVDIGVDRGVATYAYPLPEQPLDDGLPGYPGWGARADTGASVYVDVAAVPSATLTISDGPTVLATRRWGDVLKGTPAPDGAVSVEMIDRGRNWVRVTVIDEATGLPTPCRIAFQTPEGVAYAPHGHHPHIYAGLKNWNVDVGGDVRLGQVTYAYINGECEGWLPRGPVIVDVARGFEFEPVRTRVTIEPGQRELRITIRRWIDMNASGWYSGDTHVHFLSSQGALFEAAGEDLNVVNLLQTQWGHLFTSTEEFTGAPQVSADGRHTVWVSQENREHLLGHLGLLGLRAPVMPWTTGGPGEGELGGSLETTLARWADAAHARGGTVVLAHFPTPNTEAPVLVATDRADAVEMYDQLAYEHTEYYRYLNDGYRLPLVAGTDKMSSGVPVGLYRTYADLGVDEPFTFDRWTTAIRAGRTFISSGPMIQMTVDGAPVGSTIQVRPGTTVDVECEASSVLPMQTLQLVDQGRVVDEVDVDPRADAAGPKRLRLQTRVHVTGPTWLAARCGGRGYEPVRHFDDQQRGIMAHTSPVYIASNGAYDLRNDETATYMLSLIAGGREYIRSASAQYPKGTVSHGHAEVDHTAYLEEPFIEAERSIRGRRRPRDGRSA